MTTTSSTPTNDPEQHLEGPNFLLIVIMFAGASLIFIACAYLAVSFFGTDLLPNAHPISYIYSAPAKVIQG